MPYLNSQEKPIVSGICNDLTLCNVYKVVVSVFFLSSIIILFNSSELNFPLDNSEDKWIPLL